MCGIFGISNNPEASYLTYLGLHALQHRGEEACGIVSTNGRTTFRQVYSGLVDDSFNQENIKKLFGDFAIGHVRYSTAGGSVERNAQPFMAFNTPMGELAIAHNGNIPGFDALRAKSQKQGALFYTNSDTEIILVAIASLLQKKFRDGQDCSRDDFAQILNHALNNIEGAYSLLILTRKFLAAVRDPWGVRPLVLGKIRDSWVFASETNAFDLMGAHFIREVKPGEIIIVDRRDNKLSSFRLLPTTSHRRPQFCVFELVYFARPDSHFFGRDVYDVRRRMGQTLAREAPAPGADAVLAVPDSATVQALGYAEELHLPCEAGLVRSHYIGRTFIAPDQEIRDFSARLKYNPVRSLLEGKSVVIVDDSIVRGTTSAKLMRIIRDVGRAKEIHLRIASPPIRWPCFYGIDMPTKKELIASNKTVAEIRDFLGVESLSYLSLDGMLKAAGGKKKDFCTACFSGNYQIAKKTVKKSLKDVSRFTFPVSR